MSHQTGILADASVLSAFADAKSGRTRLIKLVISDDSSGVTTDTVKPVQRNWEEDYDSMIEAAVEGKSVALLRFISNCRYSISPWERKNFV